MSTLYRITIAQSALREYGSLPAAVGRRVRAAIDSLAQNPRPPGKCMKIRNSPDRWRIRVGVYRVVYDVDDESGLVDVIRIRHRKDAYRG